MEYSNGDIFDVIDYNKLVYIKNKKQIKTNTFEPVIITKKGIVYGEIVHVFSKCKIYDCVLCNKFSSQNFGIVYPKILSKL